MGSAWAAFRLVCLVVVLLFAASSLVGVPGSVVKSTPPGMPPGSYNSPVSGFFLRFDSVPSSALTLIPCVYGPVACVCSVVLVGASVPVVPPVSDVAGTSALVGVVVTGGATMRPLLLTLAGAGLFGPRDASSLAA